MYQNSFAYDLAFLFITIGTRPHLINNHCKQNPKNLVQMRKENDKAEDLLEKITPSKELSYKVLSLRLYLALIKGNVEKARGLASKYFEQELALGF